MLTLNNDLFNLKMFTILGLINFTTIAIIKNAKTFHYSFQTRTWPFAPLFTTPSDGCYWKQGFKEQNTMKSNTFASPHVASKICYRRVFFLEVCRFMLKFVHDI